MSRQSWGPYNWTPLQMAEITVDVLEKHPTWSQYAPAIVENGDGGAGVSITVGKRAPVTIAWWRSDIMSDPFMGLDEMSEADIREMVQRIWTEEATTIMDKATSVGVTSE